MPQSLVVVRLAQADLPKHGAGFDLAIALALVAALQGRARWCPRPQLPTGQSASVGVDLQQVLGEHQARRAVEVEAAGGHHLLLVGPPGSGKTILASACWVATASPG